MDLVTQATLGWTVLVLECTTVVKIDWMMAAGTLAFWIITVATVPSDVVPPSAVRPDETRNEMFATF